MALDVGVNVLEVDGRAAPVLQAAPTSIGAFLGLTERGVPHTPVRVSSLAQFQARFGNFRSERFGVTGEDGHLGYAIEGFFRNGGREAYVSRVVGAGSTAATTTLNNRATNAVPTLRVSAGYRGRPDPGRWGERLMVDVRHDPRGTTAIAAGGAAPTTTTARLASLSGVRVGTVVRIGAATTAPFGRVTAVDPEASTITWAPALVQAPAVGDPITTQEFRLMVRYRSEPTGDFDLVEDHRNLSMEEATPDYAITRINHPLTGSRFVILTDLSGAVAAGVQHPDVATGRRLTGATENAPTSSEFAGSAAQRTGLFAFDTVQVQLLAAPDSHLLTQGGPAVARAAMDYCAARSDCMYVGSAPDRGSSVSPARAPRDYNQLESVYVNTLTAYSAQFQAAKVFGALYSPWIQVIDPVGAGPAPTRFVPPDGHVMGMYARTEFERGIHQPPAGQAALLRGAMELSAHFSDRQHTHLVRTGFLNGVRRQPGAGIVVAASRTLSTDTRWWFVNVRLLFNFVKSTLRDGLRFVRQEPHSGQLRRTVRFNVVTPFLLGLWRQGAFGSDPPEAVFSVKCDEENNPPAEVEAGNFKLEVYFYPVKPAETIVIVVGQQPSGASAGEA